MSFFRTLIGRGKKVVYGTSDHFLNFGEVLMTCWVAEALRARPVFFNYPKGAAWLYWEEGLFEPYAPPSLDPFRALAEAGLPQVEVLPLQQMVEKEVGNFTLGEIADKIRAEREIQSFRALNLPNQKPVYVSSKDRQWAAWADQPLGWVVEDPGVKLGGSILYFLHGYFLARCPQYVGLLPGKQNADVLGAFEAGRAAAGGGGRIIQTGEFDFMTSRQWSLWQSDRKWRKAPAWAIRRLLESSFAKEVRTRLLAGQYCPLAYDEGRNEFFFVDI